MQRMDSNSSEDDSIQLQRKRSDNENEKTILKDSTKWVSTSIHCELRWDSGQGRSIHACMFCHKQFVIDFPPKFCLTMIRLSNRAPFINIQLLYYRKPVIEELKVDDRKRHSDPIVSPRPDVNSQLRQGLTLSVSMRHAKFYLRFPCGEGGVGGS